MSELLDKDDMAQLEPAEAVSFRSPVPVRPISNGEIMVGPQTDSQRQVEFRLRELADEFSDAQGVSRRNFLRTASGMATAFLVMNEVYGPLFEVGRAEAATLEVGAARARALSSQFVFDVHTHFLRPNVAPSSSLQFLVELRKLGRKWNPALRRKTPHYRDVSSFDNFVKEMFLDSDTKMAILSGAPAEDPNEWMLTNDAIAKAKARVNAQAGTRRLMSHAVLSPTDKRWLGEVDRAVEVHKPDAWKFYTIGDSLRLEVARPWRLDDEKLAYPAYEKFDKAGIRNVCIHKGLFPPSAELKYPHLTAAARVNDVAKAAKDWPQLNFIIYHAAFRHLGAGVDPQAVFAEFDRTGRIDWVSDLAEIPARHGVKNVYCDIGGTFATTCIDHPRLSAALLGTLIKGLGADHVTWGTDSIWFGSPQWQIEALRRIEIPADMQKRFGFAPLGAANGPVKSGILGLNSARLYGIEPQRASAEFANDRYASRKAEYEAAGGERSNLAYGLVNKSKG